MLFVMLVGSLIAGLIDALIGGGGLILLPLILICNPQFSNAEALGVNTRSLQLWGRGARPLLSVVRLNLRGGQFAMRHWHSLARGSALSWPATWISR